MVTQVGPNESGYSPDITVELILHGERFNVASVGSDMAILRDARSTKPGKGLIRITVDGKLTVHHVDLQHGIDPQRIKQPFVLIDATTEAAA